MPRQLARFDKIQDELAVTLGKDVFISNLFPAPFGERERSGITVTLRCSRVLLRIGRIGMRVEEIHAGLLEDRLGLLNAHRVRERNRPRERIEFSAALLTFFQVLHRQRALVAQQPRKHGRRIPVPPDRPFHDVIPQLDHRPRHRPKVHAPISRLLRHQQPSSSANSTMC